MGSIVCGWMPRIIFLVLCLPMRLLCPRSTLVRLLVSGRVSSLMICGRLVLLQLNPAALVAAVDGRKEVILCVVVVQWVVAV